MLNLVELYASASCMLNTMQNVNLETENKERCLKTSVPGK